MIRNITVGAPAMSLSSTATLSFVTMNNSDFKSFIGWNINIQYLSNILGESNGKLMKAIVPTLKTHESPKSYFLMVWDKLHATFSWYEIPNNVNFYLYREYIPVLFLTFISFFLIVPLALTGIFLTIYKKINAWPLLLMFLVYMFPMIAFMVLSRYRIVLVPVLIPFAALTVTELLSTWKGWKNYLIVLAVLGLGYWSSTTGNKPVSELSRNDYSGIWTAYYADKVKKEIEQNQIREVASGLQDYFDRYQPKTISEASPAYRCKDLNESDVFLYFSEMHSRFVNVYLNLRDSTNARKQKEISENLKMVASRPVRDP
jgi:hypothetical protein